MSKIIKIIFLTYDASIIIYFFNSIAAYKYSTKYRNSNRPWNSEERRRKRRNFILDFSKSQPDDVSKSSQENWPRKSSLVNESSSFMRADRSPHSQERNLNEPPKQPMFMKKSPSLPEKAKSITSPKSQIDIEKSIRERDFETKRMADRERFVKRKAKSRSPVQGTRKDIGASHSRSQGLLVDTLRRQEGINKNGKVQLNVLTSDDSSEQYRPDG